MVCCHPYLLAEDHEHAFSVDPTAISFGRGCLAELGDWCRALGVHRAALMTDARVARLEHVAVALKSLRQAGIDFAVFDEVKVEPTDLSFEAAAAFAREGRFDGYISVGGGSVIDTTKAANLFATYPAPLLTYVNAPVGDARAVPGPLKPHLACPTTSGTGSECTGIAVFDLLSLKAKTGIAHRHLKPSRALIDPNTTETLPADVVAASGFDVLSHALESFTARPFTARPKVAAPLRPVSQGANPWSDMGCREALRLCGAYLVRAVADASDREARENMMWAASLAGIAFGNAGVHAPHGMAYAVAGLVRDYRSPGYPSEEPLIPHGVSVIVNAPAVFRWTSSTSPDRHLEAAQLLGAGIGAVAAVDAGSILAEQLGVMMKACRVPNGLGDLGYDASDIAALTDGAILQKRLLDNAPLPLTREVVSDLFSAAMRCW